MTMFSTQYPQPAVEVIGPFSVWPRQRKRNVRPAILIGLAGASAAIAAHCVMPLIA